jgi:hypothetical protein
LIGKFEGKRPLRRTRCRLENNIRMDLRDIEWKVVDCIWFRIWSSGGLL